MTYRDNGYVARVGYTQQFAAAADSASTLMNDLVAYWRMEESGTDSRVDAINSLSLTANGNVSADTGKRNDAVQLEWNVGGVGYKYLNGSTDSKYSVGAGGKTWAVWISANNVAGPFILFTKGTGANDEYYFYIDANGKLWVDLIGGDGSWADYIEASGSNGDIVGGVFTLVISWYDPADKKIRFSVNNGTTRVSPTALSGTPFNGAADFLINRTGSTTYYGGLWDEMMFWDRPLTSDERAELYNSGTGKFLNSGGTDFS